MAGINDLNDLLGRPREGIGRSMVQQILRDALKPPKSSTSSILGREIDLNTITPEQAAGLTSELKDAQRDTSFSGVQEAFDILDIPGALVRGLVGAGISAAKGEGGQALERLASSLPGSENIPKLLNSIFGTDIKGVRAPEGSKLLGDLGWEQGTTAEDERRIRIAQAAGIGRSEARRKFGTGGPLDFETQVEFDALVEKAQAAKPKLDLGVTWADTKRAADAQDVAGFAVEIALDPLTYLTLGASAAGKSAKALAIAEKSGAAGLLSAVKGADTFADAAKAVREFRWVDEITKAERSIGPREQKRLLGHLEEAFKAGKPNLDLGRTLAEQAQRGQRAAGFKVPFGPEFGPKFSSGFVDQPLSVLGQSRLSESVFGEVAPGVNQTVHDFMRGTPGMKQITGIIRSVLEGGRKIAGRTGIGAADESFKGGKELAAILDAASDRTANVQLAAMRDVAKRTGVSLEDIKATADVAAETARARAQVGGYTVGPAKAEALAAEYAATLSRTGLREEDIAPIANGLLEINEMSASRAEKFNLDFQRLTDESLSYMHRMATAPAKEWIRKNPGKFRDITGGLELDTKSGLFTGRVGRWEGKLHKQINEEMAPLIDGAKFFTEDPYAATVHAAHEMHRRIGNAYTVTRIAEDFGQPVTREGAEFTAKAMYEKVGLKMSPEDAERLSKVAIPEELFKAVNKMAEIQEAPGVLFRGFQRVTNWLKATVTTLFPAFHGRNFLENYSKAVFEGGGKLVDLKDSAAILSAAQDLNMGGAGFLDGVGRYAKKQFAKIGKPSDDVMKLLKEEAGFDSLDDFANWGHGSGLFENKFTSEFGIDMRNARLGVEPSAARKAADAAGSLFGAPQRAGFALASGTENWHRLAFFLDRMKKGYGRQGALDEVKRVFFDYRDLGNIEAKFAKTLGFFYNFYRNNLRYITQTALKHPVVSKQVMRLFFEDPDNPRHSWLSDKGTFSVAGVDIALGFLPQQQFNMFSLADGDLYDKAGGKLGQAVGQMNPIWEQGLSLAFGKDLYRNLPLEYVDRAPDWSNAPEWLQRTIGLRETVSGGYVMSPRWRWLADSIPALGRFAQSQIAVESDKDYFQTLAQLVAGVRIQNQEPTKDALERMRRNIDRTAAGMTDVRKGAFGEWVTDRRTREGRVKSALTKGSPDKDDLIFLASEPEIMARLMPYVSLDEKGEPVMNRLLKDKMLALGIELYPRHAALMQAQRAQRAAQVRALSPTEQQAQEAFAALFGGQ